MDLSRAPPLVLAVIPFDQVGINFGCGAKPANSQVRAARCKGLV
jgi:hypothetical protein